MKKVFLVKVSESLSVSIYPYDDASLVDPDGLLKYRKIGNNIVGPFNETLCQKTDEDILVVFNPAMQIDFSFPIVRLNTEMNMMNYLLNIFKEETIDIIVDVFGLEVVQKRIDQHKKLGKK